VKVKDLIETLQMLPQGSDVYLAADAEGNYYSRLEDFVDTPYVYKDEILHGRTESLIYADELEDATPEDMEALEPVVVLWPV